MLRTTLVLGAVALLLVSTGATAGTWENSREGFMIGFNAGGGGAALELSPKDGGTISTDRESGGAGNFRIGYAVKPNLTLAFETNGWLKSETETIFDSEVETSYGVQVASFAATFWPGNGGFYMRGGLGVGTGKITAKSDGFEVETSESGLGLLAALGYEWRLTEKFALGPQLDFGYLNLGEVDTVDDDGNDVTADYSVNYVNLSVGFNWYW